eukprot:COSAG01_NODE_5200_length_4415_cov_3.887396_2_plen_104_part_00
MGARQPATILLDSELTEPPAGNGTIGCATPAAMAAPEPEAEALVATGVNDGGAAAEEPVHDAASVAHGDAPPGVGVGESFMRVHWVAVPKALRARRVNRRCTR